MKDQTDRITRKTVESANQKGTAPAEQEIFHVHTTNYQNQPLTTKLYSQQRVLRMIKWVAPERQVSILFHVI